MASILVIDDERHIRDLLRKVLEGAGHTVKEASNGRDAMRIWRESPVDLIITDILMPEQDGLEFIRELRREVPSAKIIALSGGSKRIHLDTLAIAKRFGALHTLHKPFEIKELLNIVGNVLDQSV
ncbi:MAG: response regulator [Nitrospiraceae bacterium]|nr:response regulator [Nitrospiraceae bacterium]